MTTTLRTFDIREAIAKKYKRSEFITDKTGAQTVEIIGASFIADRPAIYGEVNEEYVQRELSWYNSQSLYVKDIGAPVPRIWTAVSDINGKINSNYGYLIYNKDNAHQYDNVLKELISSRDSRRAVMIYTRPSMHDDYNSDGMNDFICTNAVQYLIRNGQLNTVVQMRSNDVVYGYRNDYAWQKHVADKLVSDYNQNMTCQEDHIVLGDIFWQVGSLHVYSRHFSLIQEYIDRNGH